MASSSSSPASVSLVAKLSALEERFRCVICAGRLQRPVNTVCGHTYCSACVDRMFEVSSSEKRETGTGVTGMGVACPLCKTTLRRRSICHTQRTRSIVDAIQKIADEAKNSIKVSFAVFCWLVCLLSFLFAGLSVSWFVCLLSWSWLI